LVSHDGTPGFGARFLNLTPQLTKLINDFIQGIRTTDDLKGPKTRLQEMALAAVKRAPKYEVIGRTRDELYQVKVILCGHTLAEGTGHNKRQAEKASARAALEHLNTIEDLKTICRGSTGPKNRQ
jgi:dsRNA-specific ribonuclease